MGIGITNKSIKRVCLQFSFKCVGLSNFSTVNLKQPHAVEVPNGV